MKNLFDISNKIIVVTGAGGVLAGAVGRYLLTQDATVVFLVHRAESVESLQQELGHYGDKFTACTCNVLERAQVERAYEQIMAKYGRVDVLINGAGGNRPGAVIGPEQTIFDVDLDEYSAVLDLNLKGTLLPTMVFAKAMRAQQKGAIVNFSSMSAPQALTRVLGYSNAKGAIDNLTRFLAVELAKKFGPGLRVNAIAPGFFISNQNRALLTNPDGSYTERGNQVIAKTPLGRFGEADEIFGCIHYLISDAAQFVTGSIIPVDGGFSAFTGV